MVFYIFTQIKIVIKAVEIVRIKLVCFKKNYKILEKVIFWEITMYYVVFFMYKTRQFRYLLKIIRESKNR